MSEPYIAPSVKSDWMDRLKAEGVLHDGEEIQFAVGGLIEKEKDMLTGKGNKGTGTTIIEKGLKTDRRRGITAITNMRLLFYMPKLLGRYEFDSYELDTINAVEFTKGMRKGRVQVTGINDDKVIKGLDNAEGKMLAEKLQELIVKRRQDAKAPQVAAAQSPEDALKMRLINGEITQEEYENLKKILNG